MSVKILEGDCRDVLKTLPDASVHCCVTSPPYFGLRDYGVNGQMGLEPTPDEYIAGMVSVFREVRRVLRDDGTLWLNLGDSYAGYWGDANAKKEGRRSSADTNGWTNGFNMNARPRFHQAFSGTGIKPKDLIGIPWMLAFALRADGWYLRQDIIWAKPNPMPESVRDRCTKSHEYLFLLSKSQRYYFDAEAIAEPAESAGKPVKMADGWDTGAGGHGSFHRAGREKGASTGALQSDTRNKRSVWHIATQPFKEAHFATFPPALVEPCILAGCPPAGKRCDCDVIIGTPTGDGEISDPSLITGRAGMNRPRRRNEGRREITRREQRWDAEQLKGSPYRNEMRAICGPAFDHYIRTDDTGARPLPPAIREDFARRGWVTDAPPCTHPIEPAGTVLDPFGGAGTTGLVADRLQRNALLIELNAEYAAIARRRVCGDSPLFSEVG